jgi:hypothetical protein
MHGRRGRAHGANREVLAQPFRTIGAEYVGKPESPLKGHCVLVASVIYGQALNVAPDPVPHARHANIRGWSDDAKNRVIAKNLADAATLTVY